MLWVENRQDNGYKLFSLRNDFTIPEYLLIRFMSEKKITESDLVQYPHMQQIYENMDKDKRSFSCTHGELK